MFDTLARSGVKIKVEGRGGSRGDPGEAPGASRGFLEGSRGSPGGLPEDSRGAPGWISGSPAPGYGVGGVRDQHQPKPKPEHQ